MQAGAEPADTSEPAALAVATDRELLEPEQLDGLMSDIASRLSSIEGELLLKQNNITNPVLQGIGWSLPETFKPCAGQGAVVC